MNGTLSAGDSVHTVSGRVACTVQEFLADGGQGEVYRARLGGTDLALKWYFPHQATPEQRRSLEQLISKGPPDGRFLWPLHLVESPRHPSTFGYLMPLRARTYRSILDLVKRRVDPSFRVLATAGFHLADAFQLVHSHGLCYRDISFGNAFLDPSSGSVLICDNDNVAVDGTDAGGVLGTPDFMAPEIVRGEGKPSTHTDLYSLAVLLFYIFHIHHPLFGKRVLAIRCLDLPARRRLCGDEPLFIFDPKDRANEAVGPQADDSGEAGANALAFWPIYPTFLRDLFTKSFTDGLRDPNKSHRVRETEWRDAMIQLRDAIFHCGCGVEVFYDAATVRSGASCWSCKRPLQFPFRLRLRNRDVVMLTQQTLLYPHHLVADREYDFSKPLAEVSQNPTNPAILGLKNLSTEKWVRELPDGTMQDVPPGRSVALSEGLRINFGPWSGEVRK